MGFYKFIKIEGREGRNTGYFVPKLYPLSTLSIGLKIFGFSYIIERLRGCTFWYTFNKDDYIQAIKTLDELKKTRIFNYYISV